MGLTWHIKCTQICIAIYMCTHMHVYICAHALMAHRHAHACSNVQICVVCACVFAVACVSMHICAYVCMHIESRKEQRPSTEPDCNSVIWEAYIKWHQKLPYFQNFTTPMIA